MVFYLIAWKEFNDRKLVDKADIVKTDDIVAAMANMKTMNAQKRLTTTDYIHVNLSALFVNKSLDLIEIVKE